MHLLDLKLDELVLILDALPIKEIGKASFVCRAFKEASDSALAGVKYVKLRSKSEKLALALVNKLRSVRTVLNHCADSEKIIQSLTFNCTKIQTMIGFLPQHALYYVRNLKARGEPIFLKKLIVCALKKDIRIKTIELLIQEVPDLKLGISVGHAPGSRIDLDQVLPESILARIEILSVGRIPWNAIAKLPCLKEIETAMGSGPTDPLDLSELVASSNSKLEKISISWVTRGFLHLFNQHILTLKEVSFINYETNFDEDQLQNFARFLTEFGSLATPTRRRKFFASLECPLDVETLFDIIESSCQWVDLLIHTGHSAVIQQVDSKGRSFLRKHLAHVRFGIWPGRSILELLKENRRIQLVGNELYFVKRDLT